MNGEQPLNFILLWYTQLLYMHFLAYISTLKWFEVHLKTELSLNCRHNMYSWYDSKVGVNEISGKNQIFLGYQQFIDIEK